MMIRYILTGMMVIVAAVGAAKAVPTVQKVSDTVVHSAALTFPFGSVYGDAINGLSFQQEAVMSHNGWQYVVYYSGDRRVCLSRRCLPDGPWQTIVFTDYYFSGTDAHDVAVMGLCPNDGTIHLAFDHHGDTLHYRVSQAGAACEPGQMTWSAALFGPVRTWLEQEGKTVTQVTYPRFFQTPEGDMKLAYRYTAPRRGQHAGGLRRCDGDVSGSRMVIHRREFLPIVWGPVIIAAPIRTGGIAGRTGRFSDVGVAGKRDGRGQPRPSIQ